LSLGVLSDFARKERIPSNIHCQLTSWIGRVLALATSWHQLRASLTLIASLGIDNLRAFALISCTIEPPWALTIQAPLARRIKRSNVVIAPIARSLATDLSAQGAVIQPFAVGAVHALLACHKVAIQALQAVAFDVAALTVIDVCQGVALLALVLVEEVAPGALVASRRAVAVVRAAQAADAMAIVVTVEALARALADGVASSAHPTSSSTIPAFHTRWVLAFGTSTPFHSIASLAHSSLADGEGEHQYECESDGRNDGKGPGLLAP